MSNLPEISKDFCFILHRWNLDFIFGKYFCFERIHLFLSLVDIMLFEVFCLLTFIYNKYLENIVVVFSFQQYVPIV